MKRKKTEENGKKTRKKQKKTEENGEKRKRHRSGDPFCETPFEKLLEAKSPPSFGLPELSAPGKQHVFVRTPVSTGQTHVQGRRKLLFT